MLCPCRNQFLRDGIFDYMEQRRQRAARLFAAGKMSLAEIARELR